jgi:hypothetical protein
LLPDAGRPKTLEGIPEQAPGGLVLLVTVLVLLVVGGIATLFQ